LGSTSALAGERMRRRWGAGIIAVTLAVASACSTGPDLDKAAAADLALFRGRAECSRLFADVTLDPIRSRVALGIFEKLPSRAELLSDPIRAEDKPIIEVWLRDRDECWAAHAAWRALEPPVFTDMMTAAFLVETALIAELYVGRLTYRQFAAERARLAAATRRTFDLLEEAGTRFRQQQVTDGFVADAQRQLGSEPMAQALQQMQAAMRDPSKCHIASDDDRCV
jgi:hypothetical protein